MARFYANENFSRPVVEALRTRGHEVLTTAEAGKADQEIPDNEVLASAIQEQRCMLTINRRDFSRLHRQSAQHSGIVVCTFDADFAGQAERIDAAVARQSSLAGKLIRVNRGDFTVDP